MASAYNTNLSAEFHVLSMLHRLGIDANLTLGNKKSVDIAAVRAAGDAITIDVKGLAGTTGWPVDNLGPAKRGHYVVFVCFSDRIANTEYLPLVWVIPSEKIDGLTYQAPGGRRLVRYSALRDKGGRYKSAWKLLS